MMLFKIPAQIKILWKLNYLRSAPYDIACKKAPSPEPDFMIDKSGGSLSLGKFSLMVILTVISLIATEKNKNCQVNIYTYILDVNAEAMSAMEFITAEIIFTQRIPNRSTMNGVHKLPINYVQLHTAIICAIIASSSLN